MSSTLLISFDVPDLHKIPTGVVCALSLSALLVISGY